MADPWYMSSQPEFTRHAARYAVRQFRFWYLLFWILGAGAILCSAAAGLRPHGDDSWIWRFIPFAGAASAALTTLLNPKERAERYNGAWIILRSALNRHPNDVEKMNDAWEKSEAVLNSGLYEEYVAPKSDVATKVLPHV